MFRRHWHKSRRLLKESWDRHRVDRLQEINEATGAVKRLFERVLKGAPSLGDLAGKVEVDPKTGHPDKESFSGTGTNDQERTDGAEATGFWGPLAFGGTQFQAQ